MITKFIKYNENIKSLLVGPTEEEILKSFINMKPDDILIKSIDSDYLDGIKYALRNNPNMNYRYEPNMNSYPIRHKFLQYLMDGKFEIIKFLVDSGMNTNFSSYGETPLIIAVNYDRIDVVKLLLNNRGDINQYNDLLLINASIFGYTEMVKLLIENGSNVNVQHDKALSQSCLYGRYDVVKILLENGAKINSRNYVALKNAERNKHTKIINLLYDYIKKYPKIYKKYQQTNESIKSLLVGPTEEEVLDNLKNLTPDELLIKSVRKGLLIGVKKSLENGADINIDNGKPLCDSSFIGRINIVKYLIENGADIHIRKEEPLKQSMYGNNYDITKYLLENGADPKIDNWEPYRIASKRDKRFEVLLHSYIYGTNESIKHLLTGPSEEEVWKSFGYNRTFDTPEEFINYILENYTKHDGNSKTIHHFIGHKKMFTEHIINKRNIEYSINYNNFTKIIMKIFGKNRFDAEHLLYDAFNKKINKNNFIFTKKISIILLPGEYTPIDESIKHLLTGPSEEEAWKTIKNKYKDRSRSDQDYKLIITACEKGIMIGLIEMFDIKKINVKFDNELPIRVAAQYGQVETMKFLKERGADIHANGDVPLLLAIDSGEVESVKYILDDKNIDMSENMLIIPISDSDDNFILIKTLMEYGKSFKDNVYLLTAVKNNNFNIVKLLLETYTYDKYTIRTTINNTESSYHYKIVELLKKYMNESTNESIKSLLIGPTDEEVWDNIKKLPPVKMFIVSCKIGYLKGIEESLKMGSNINSQDCDLEDNDEDIYGDGDSEFGISYLIHNKYNDILKYLLNKYSSKMYLEDFLESSVSDGNFEATKLLVDHGAFINDNNYSVFALAVTHNDDDDSHYEIVKYLLDHGADPYLSGDYAVDYALGDTKKMSTLIKKYI